MSSDQVRAFLETIAEADGIVAGIVLSTCNRTEIYVETANGAPIADGVRAALDRVGIDSSYFEGPHGQHLRGEEALRHLYRVVAGLESMMLGEPQIAGQVKDAYRTAKETLPLGPILMRAFQGAFRAGKMVRTQTKIGEGAISVAFAAVELARKLFDDLGRRRALLVGAGKTGGLAARHFLRQGIANLTIVNRSEERSRSLVRELNGKSNLEVRARSFAELSDAVAEADVVLTTTGSTEPVILPEMVRAAMAERRGTPLFILDIAVPRDVHPDVAGVDGVYLFGLEDLNEIVQSNLAARRKEIPNAEKLIEEELKELQQWIRDLELRPTLQEFKAFLEELREIELRRIRRQTSDEIESVVDACLQRYVKTLLRRSVTRLKEAESSEERRMNLYLLRRLFSREAGPTPPPE
jgi:glutamyl-tRNA reductase